jgi:hypothetical protein
VFGLACEPHLGRLNAGVTDGEYGASGAARVLSRRTMQHKARGLLTFMA